MKKRYIVLIVAGGFIAFLGAIFAIVMYATSGITDTADKFFAAAKDKDYETALSLTSQSIQRQNSPEELADYLKANGLDLVTETSWANRSIENNVGTVSGTATTSDGGTIPLTLSFVSEGDEWRISTIDVADSGLKSSGRAASGPELGEGVPPIAKIISLARTHTQGWADTVRNDDYEFFAKYWVPNTTGAELRESYAEQHSFSDEELKQLINAQPRIHSAMMREDDLLEIESYFEIKGASVRSRLLLANISEEGSEDWKIDGLQIASRRE